MRSIIQNPLFEQQANGIFPEIRRRDERMRGVEIVLGSKPEIGVVVPGTVAPMVYAIMSELWVEGPGFVIFYTFNATQVILLGIQLSAVLDPPKKK